MGIVFHFRSFVPRYFQISATHPSWSGFYPVRRCKGALHAHMQIRQTATQWNFLDGLELVFLQFTIAVSCSVVNTCCWTVVFALCGCHFWIFCKEWQHRLAFETRQFLPSRLYMSCWWSRRWERVIEKENSKITSVKAELHSPFMIISTCTWSSEWVPAVPGSSNTTPSPFKRSWERMGYYHAYNETWRGTRVNCVSKIHIRSWLEKSIHN